MNLADSLYVYENNKAILQIDNSGLFNVSVKLYQGFPTQIKVLFFKRSENSTLTIKSIDV